VDQNVEDRSYTTQIKEVENAGSTKPPRASHAGGYALQISQVLVSLLAILAQRFRFPPFQFSLAMFGGLTGVSSGLEIYSLDEVAPAVVPI
jgi:hypothetical protein